MYISVACIHNHELFPAAFSQKVKGHIDAHRDARRIGNGAIDHIQLVYSLSHLSVPERAFCSAPFHLYDRVTQICADAIFR